MTYKIPIDIPEIQYFTEQTGLQTESGAYLPNFTLGYHTYGHLHEGSKVIWVCHALTANSHVTDWWNGLFGAGRLFDPEKYFIVCSNILGSCYGSTGAASLDPNTGLPYGLNFPSLTIRDLANAQIMLMKHLGIEEIFLCIGGSCGGHQALELGILLSSKINNLALLVCGARESAWSIAVHEAQRMALSSDPTLHDETDISSGARGLAAARGIGLLMYRTYEQYVLSQTSDISQLDDFRASSYLQYQGEKLVKRFFAKNYYLVDP